jgi:hypothetical protein
MGLQTCLMKSRMQSFFDIGLTAHLIRSCHWVVPIAGGIRRIPIPQVATDMESQVLHLRACPIGSA